MTPREELIALRRLAELEAKAKTAPVPKIGGLQGTLRNFARGASFGLDDELAGAVSALTGGEYRSAVDEYRAQREQFAQENPWTAGVANLAGGLATGIGGTAKVAASKAAAPLMAKLAGMSAVGRYGAGVAGGAGIGGFAGAADAPEGERLEGGLRGAALGGTVSAALPAIGAVARFGAKKIAGPAAFIADKFRTPEKIAARKVAQALERDAITPQKWAANLRKLGPEGMPAEAGGENVLGLTDAVTSVPGKARNEALKTLKARAKTAYKRTSQAIFDTMGVQGANVDDAIQQLHARQRVVGRGYEPVFKAGVVNMTPELEQIIKRPSVQKGFRKAITMAAERDDDAFIKYLKLDPKTKLISWAEKPTLETIDAVKRGIDRVVDDAMDPVTGKLSSEAVDALATKKDLLRIIDRQNPAYAQIRADYADEKTRESAIAFGRKLFSPNMDVESIERIMKDMDPVEREFANLGGIRAVYDKIMGAPDAADQNRRIFASPGMRQRIRALFPDNKTYAKFARRMATEARFAETRNKLAGGSVTALRLAQREDAGVDPLLIADALRGNVRGTIADVGRDVMRPQNQIPEPVRDALGGLVSMDPARQAALMGLVGKYPGIVPGRPMFPPGGGYGGLLGLSGQAGMSGLFAPPGR